MERIQNSTTYGAAAETSCGTTKITNITFKKMHRWKYKSKKCNKEKKQTTLKNIQKARNQVKRIVKEKSWKDFGEK